MGVYNVGWGVGSADKGAPCSSGSCEFLEPTLGSSQVPLAPVPGESVASGCHGHLHSYTHTHTHARRHVHTHTESDTERDTHSCTHMHTHIHTPPHTHPIYTIKNILIFKKELSSVKTGLPLRTNIAYLKPRMADDLTQFSVQSL